MQTNDESRRVQAKTIQKSGTIDSVCSGGTWHVTRRLVTTTMIQIVNGGADGNTLACTYNKNSA